MDETRQVWKYELQLTDRPQRVPIPQPGRIVHVAIQRDQLCLWAEVWPDNVEADRWFVVEGTGHPIRHVGRHVGSALSSSGMLVWHVYEVSGPDEAARLQPPVRYDDG